MECRRISSCADTPMGGASSAATDALAALAAVNANIPNQAKNDVWVASFENRRTSAEALSNTQENCNW
jgi:hypothetical protein